MSLLRCLHFDKQLMYHSAATDILSGNLLNYYDYLTDSLGLVL